MLAAAVLLSTLAFGSLNASAEPSSGLETGWEEEEQDGYFAYLEQVEASNYSGEDVTAEGVAYARQEGAQLSAGDYLGRPNVLLWTGGAGFVEWTVEAPSAGYYQIGLLYCALPDSETDIECAVTVNGVVPFEEAESLLFPRMWKNEGSAFVDAVGNESSPQQIQEECWQEQYARDKEGLSVTPFRFYLEAGHNRIGIRLLSGSIAIDRLFLSGWVESESAAAVRQSHAGAAVYQGEDIVLQGEDAQYKSAKDLRPLSDSTDPSVYPADTSCDRLNYIGAGNWDSPGETLLWELEIPETGFYRISFKYRQSAVVNSSSYRRLTIDGKSLCAETDAVAFPYDMNWRVRTPAEEDGEDLLVYLEKGSYTFGMEVTLGPVADITRRLESVSFEVGELYRRIVMITGSTPDVNRDYRLYDQIPGLMEDLETYRRQLVELADEYDALAGKKGGSGAAALRELSYVLENMHRSKFRMHEYVGSLFSSYSSASAWVFEMRSMPLDLDAIIFSAPDRDVERAYTATAWQKLVYGFRRFVASFTTDYNKLSQTGEDGAPTLSLWINWGRDQAQLLNTLTQESFTPQTGIQVGIKVTSANLIQGLLSGQAPDCVLMAERTLPVNMAMRGALLDLSAFEDFDDVMQRFGTGAGDCYVYDGGIYGIPDTRTFPVMFVRTDVFAELGLTVPKTWEDLRRCAEVIMRNNMNLGIPNLFTSLLYQYGGSMYTADRSRTDLMTTESVAAFNFMASLYKEYKFPVTYDFYSRFRTGEMPLGIADYTEYARLTAAAPEIRGRWRVYPVPGVEKEDGSIDRTVADTGTAAVILKSSRNQEAAWLFLKWWTDEETQVRYATGLESVMGVAARHPTSNLDAFAKLAWEKDDLAAITQQRESAISLPEMPGGYYLTRALENAFYSTVFEGAVGRDELYYWSGMVNEEMARKRLEYPPRDGEAGGAE